MESFDAFVLPYPHVVTLPVVFGLKRRDIYHEASIVWNVTRILVTYEVGFDWLRKCFNSFYATLELGCSFMQILAKTHHSHKTSHALYPLKIEYRKLLPYASPWIKIMIKAWIKIMIKVWNTAESEYLALRSASPKLIWYRFVFYNVASCLLWFGIY